MKQKPDIALIITFICYIITLAVMLAVTNNMEHEINRLNQEIEDLNSQTIQVIPTMAEVPPDIVYVPLSIETPLPSPSVEPIPETVYYDIPLSHELQDYTVSICEEYDIDPILIYALMEAESSYRTDIISKTNDYGLMQINKCNHNWLTTDLGITDFLDPYDNIMAGIYILSGIFEDYDDIHSALMVYNAGASGAKTHYFNKGITSTKYSRGIVDIMGTIEQE